MHILQFRKKGQAAGQNYSSHRGYILFFTSAAIISALLVIISTSLYGAGITYDSTIYIALAENFNSGQSIIRSDYVAQPPLYPVILGLCGSNPQRSAHIINAFALGLTVFLSGILLLRMIGPGLLNVAGILVIITAGHLVFVSVMVWTEIIFIWLTVLFLLLIHVYIKKGGIPALVLMSVCAVLASYTRYIGITTVISGIFIILLISRNSLRKRIFHSLLFFILSGTPYFAWIYRNFIVSGNYFGPRLPSKYSFIKNTEQAIKIFFSWFLKEKSLQSWFVYISLYLMLGLIFILILAYMARAASKERLSFISANAGSLIIFSTVYLSFLLISSTAISYDKIDARLLSPIFIPAVLILVFFAKLYKDLLEKRVSKRLVNFLLIIFTLVILLPSINTKIENTAARIREGAGGYSTNTWRKSETIIFLQSNELEKGYIIYSNVPDALYILADIRGKTSPLKKIPASGDIVSWPDSDRAYLVWLKDRRLDTLLDIHELKGMADLELYRQFSDGAIYTVSKRY